MHSPSVCVEDDGEDGEEEEGGEGEEGKSVSLESPSWLAAGVSCLSFLLVVVNSVSPELHVPPVLSSMSSSTLTPPSLSPS